MGLLQAAAGGLTLGGFVRGVFDAGNSLLRFERLMTAISTSPDELAGHSQFIEELTHDLPIGLRTAQDEYSKFAVATRLVGMNAEDTQSIFRGFSTAFSALGASTERQRFGFLALSQIVSKDMVTMEDLRQQLGEHMPGALALLADSLGVTTAALEKMVEAREVRPDALVGMAKLAEQVFRGQIPAAIATSQARLVFFGNAWERLKQTMFESGFDSGLAAMFDRLTASLRTPEFTAAAQNIGRTLGDIFAGLGAIGTVAMNHADDILRVVGAIAGIGALNAAVRVITGLSSPMLILGAAIVLLPEPLDKVAIGFAALTALTIPLAMFNVELALLLRRLLLLPMAAAGVWRIGEEIGLAGLRGLAQLSPDPDFARRLEESIAQKGTPLANAVKWLAEPIDALIGSATDFAGNALESIFPNVTAEMDKALAATRAAQDGFAATQADTARMLSDNAAREAERARLAQDAFDLTRRQQQLLDSLDPIAKANREYKEQIALLDQLLARTGTAGGIDQGQHTALRSRLDRTTLDDRDPFAAYVRSQQEELALLRLSTDARDVEREVLSARNDLLARGVDLTSAQVEAVRGLATAMRDLERGGSTGFGQWAHDTKNFGEALNEVERGALDDFADKLADVITTGRADWASFWRSLVHEVASAAIRSLMKDTLGNLFGGARAAETALANAQATALSPTGMLPDTVANMNVAAGTVNLAGSFTGIPNIPVERYDLAPLPGAPVAADYAARQLNLAPSWTPGIDRFDELMPRGASGTGTGMTETLRDRFDTAFGGSRPLVDPNLFKDFGGQVQTLTKLISLGAADMDYIGRTVMTEVDHGLLTRNPMAYNAQIEGVTDTMLNRVAAGRWGGSVADVANARWQFSGINSNLPNAYGSVQNAPRANAYVQDYVDRYVGARAAGTPSSVGGNLNYLNPYYSSQRSLNAWGNDVVAQGTASGQAFGQGRSMHFHGTAPGLSPVDPFGINMATAGAQSGQQFATAFAPSIQTTATRFGTSMQQPIQATAQQFRTAMQPQFDQSGTMFAQSLQPANGQVATDYVMKMQQANSQIAASAQGATGGFTAAGQALGQAGTQAQAATGGIGGFAQGLGGLLGPLGQILQMVLGGGNAGGLLQAGLSLVGGLFAEGGRTGSPVASVSASAAMWRNAPRYAAGTDLAKRAGGMSRIGDGWAAVLHDHEAVIPLSRGRTVPVELTGDRPEGAGARPNVTVHMTVKTPDAASFRKSSRQVSNDLMSDLHVASRANG